jgi:predicted metal-dependent hydrolase
MDKSAPHINTLYFSTGGSEYPIFIQYNGRQKHIRLRITSEGRIVLSAPTGTSRSKIRGVLNHKQEWLASKIQETDQGLKQNNPTEKVYLEGRLFLVEFENPALSIYSIEVDYEQQKVCISGDPANPQKITGLLEEWLRKEAQARLAGRAERVSEELGIPYKKLFLRNQRTRWGSSSTRGNISLNWRTVMAPPAVQRYLLIHELVHQKHMNHSTRFWLDVGRVCPGYRQHEAWLRENRALMGLFRDYK